jgi:hypothetical protein
MDPSPWTVEDAAEILQTIFNLQIRRPATKSGLFFKRPRSQGRKGVAHLAAELRRPPPQKGRGADAEPDNDSTTTSTAPPAGTLPKPRLYTSRDPGFPHPPAAAAAAGGGGNPRITGERAGSTGGVKNRLSLL